MNIMNETIIHGFHKYIQKKMEIPLDRAGEPPSLVVMQYVKNGEKKLRRTASPAPARQPLPAPKTQSLRIAAVRRG